jgi:hypothetical protein
MTSNNYQEYVSVDILLIVIRGHVAPCLHIIMLHLHTPDSY